MMNFDDYNTTRTLVNQFYDITDTMIKEINEGEISSNDMDRYTEQVVAICETITSIYCADILKYQHQCYLYKEKEKEEKEEKERKKERR